MIQRLQTGDTLIVTKLDLFARSTAIGSSLINELLQRGVAVQILNMGLIDNTPNEHKSYNEVVELTGLSKSTLTRAVRHAKANLLLEKDLCANS